MRIVDRWRSQRRARSRCRDDAQQRNWFQYLQVRIGKVDLVEAVLSRVEQTAHRQRPEGAAKPREQPPLALERRGVRVKTGRNTDKGCCLRYCSRPRYFSLNFWARAGASAALGWLRMACATNLSSDSSKHSSQYFLLRPVPETAEKPKSSLHRMGSRGNRQQGRRRHTWRRRPA